MESKRALNAAKAAAKADPMNAALAVAKAKAQVEYDKHWKKKKTATKPKVTSKAKRVAKAKTVSHPRLLLLSHLMLSRALDPRSPFRIQPISPTMTIPRKPSPVSTRF